MRAVDLRAEIEAGEELGRQDVAALEKVVAELRGEAARPREEGEAGAGEEEARRRVELLEAQVAGLLEVVEEQSSAVAELQVLRPKYAKLERELMELKEGAQQSSDGC
mmetsp:Transcript_34437/g.85734  ORF Transcript_34437/g.85734 Transcript_34437/m.85734 type:complete len:108 (-) Transcript_34437:162-485(-)